MSWLKYISNLYKGRFCWICFASFAKLFVSGKPGLCLCSRAHQMGIQECFAQGTKCFFELSGCGRWSAPMQWVLLSFRQLPQDLTVFLLGDSPATQRQSFPMKLHFLSVSCFFFIKRGRALLATPIHLIVFLFFITGKCEFIEIWSIQ